MAPQLFETTPSPVKPTPMRRLAAQHRFRLPVAPGIVRDATRGEPSLVRPGGHDREHEAGDLQRKLFAENEAKYNGEFRANPKLAVNEVDRPAFREASAKVIDTWRAKPFGDFVERLAKTARA